MTSSFDRDRESYRGAVDASISFTGRDVDFFARLKADDLVDTLDRHAGGAAEARVLDVGCGPGITDAYLVGRVGELHGADLSRELLAAAAAANPEARYHWFDGVALPFDDGAFDASFAICVLHHVNPGERAALVGEMARVTRAGGLVVIYEHNPLNPLTRVVVARCEFDEDVVLLRPAETQRLLRGARAPDVESRYIAFFPWQTQLLRAIERGLSRVPLGGQFVVIGRVAQMVPAHAQGSQRA
jgi:SAM-dependent methyltransferase